MAVERLRGWVANVEETSKSTLFFDLQKPHEHMNAHCLTTAGGRVHERALGRGGQRIAVITNSIQLPHVSLTHLKTFNIIMMTVKTPDFFLFFVRAFDLLIAVVM